MWSELTKWNKMDSRYNIKTDCWLFFLRQNIATVLTLKKLLKIQNLYYYIIISGSNHVLMTVKIFFPLGSNDSACVLIDNKKLRLLKLDTSSWFLK